MLAPMPLRLAMLTPFGPPAARGNAVTVARIARGLGERGVELRVWDLSAVSPATIESEVEAYRPALIHGFHAYRVGPLALRLAQRVAAPLVVTLTGTDANHDLFDGERTPVVRRVLEGAARITVFHQSLGERVGAVVPDVKRRVVVVPQAVRLPVADSFDLRNRWPVPPGAILFVFPVGLRAVKNPVFPLGPLGRLTAAIPEMRLLYAGPVLEPSEGEALQRALAARPWARHVGEVPHSQMASLLSQADVVLNCSISEGGMANAVLEALSLGRAVLASDIDGNRSIVADGVTGFLFRDEVEFERRAAQLARDPALRERLGSAGSALVAERFSPAREIDGYCEIYRELVPARSSAS
jgi:glycosyltransferase involved in cell wall biosynthesis